MTTTLLSIYEQNDLTRGGAQLCNCYIADETLCFCVGLAFFHVLVSVLVELVPSLGAAHTHTCSRLAISTC